MEEKYMFFAIVLYIVGAFEMFGGVFVLLDSNMGGAGLFTALILFAGSFKEFALGFLLEKTTKTYDCVESFQYQQNDMIKNIRNELSDIKYAIKNNTTKHLD